MCENFFDKEIKFYLQEISYNLNNLDLVLPNELFKIKPTYEFIYDENSEYEDDGPNALARCVDYKNHKYQIILGAQLFKFLYSYVKEIEIDNIFTNSQSNIDVNSKYRIVLLIWCNFICLHELSHILNGHLIFLENKYPDNYLNEFHMLETIDEKIVNDILMLEVDADSLASILSAYFFSFSIENFKKNSKLNNDESLFMYCSSIIYLFDALDSLSNRDCIRSTHPSPLERMTLINPQLKESFLNLDIVSKDKDIIYKSLRNYILSSSNTNIERLEKIYKEGLVGHQYDKFVQKVKLKEYSYLELNSVEEK